MIASTWQEGKVIDATSEVAVVSGDIVSITIPIASISGTALVINQVPCVGVVLRGAPAGQMFAVDLDCVYIPGETSAVKTATPAQSDIVHLVKGFRPATT